MELSETSPGVIIENNISYFNSKSLKILDIGFGCNPSSFLSLDSKYELKSYTGVDTIKEEEFDIIGSIGMVKTDNTVKPYEQYLSYHEYSNLTKEKYSKEEFNKKFNFLFNKDVAEFSKKGIEKVDFNTLILSDFLHLKKIGNRMELFKNLLNFASKDAVVLVHAWNKKVIGEDRVISGSINPLTDDEFNLIRNSINVLYEKKTCENNRKTLIIGKKV